MACVRFVRRFICSFAIFSFGLLITPLSLSAMPQEISPAAAEPAAPVATDAAAPAPAEPALPPCKGKKCPKAEKKKKAKKEKPPIVTPATITRGTFTVDGAIAKAALNYTIPDLKFLYFYAPGVGAVIVSDNKFAGSKEQKNAFDGHTLTVKADGHDMQLYSDDILLGKRAKLGKGGVDKKPESAWVALDPNFTMPSRFPTVGYGDKPTAPYTWPGSKVSLVAKGIDPDAPPVPMPLTPVLAEQPCPAGQVLIKTTVLHATGKATISPKCILAKDAPVAAAPYVPVEKRARE